MLDFDIIVNPEKHGYEECKHCNGYGSSLQETVDICTHCSGTGVVRKEKTTTDEKESTN